MTALSSPSNLTIGQLAARVGIATSAIRFYERRGVLPPPVRVGGQRRYSAEAVTRLNIIEIGKLAGFTLEEIGELMRAADEGHPTHERLAELARVKLSEVDALARRVREMQRWLRKASDCSCTSFESCELFTTDAIDPKLGAGFRPGRVRAA